MTEEHDPHWVRVLAAVTVAATLSMQPVFLLGAAAPSVQADLRFDGRQLGLAVSAFWMAMALGGLFSGRLAAALGPGRTLVLGVATAVASLMGMLAAPSWSVVLAAASVGGLSAALTTPAGDMAVFAAAPARRRGIAYGVKQASLPAASLLAGLGVPAIVLTLGWRWAFGVGALLAVPALLALPRRLSGGGAPSSAVGAPAGRHGLGDVVPVAVAVALAMSAVSATGGFFVESAVAGGMEAEHAGLLLAVGSGCGIVGRFVFSWRLARLRRPLDLVAGLLALGGIGLGGFTVVGPGPLLVLATVLAFGAGWGWNGLLTQTVVAAHPEATARASAYIMVGAAVGGVVGPVTFGLVAAAAGHSCAWAVAAGALLAAAALLLSLRVLTPRGGLGGGHPAEAAAR